MPPEALQLVVPQRTPIQEYRHRIQGRCPPLATAKGRKLVEALKSRQLLLQSLGFQAFSVSTQRMGLTAAGNCIKIAQGVLCNTARLFEQEVLTS